jgi:hypothetical protein
MKNLLTKASLLLLVTGLVSLGTASISWAQEAPEKSGASEISETSVDPQSLPGNYGLVRSFDGKNLEVRTLDGTAKTYAVPEGTLTTVKQGDLVGFDVDDQGLISNVQPPAVDEVIRGKITNIDPETQTVTLMPEGSNAPVDTQISPETVSRLNLEPGKEIMVTKYEGTWANKVCLPKAAAPLAAPPLVPPAAEIEPEPVGGIEPAPEVEPIPALW